jgi:hypothetical protein
MHETQRIADQLRRSHNGSAWHGPALKELLSGVTSERAAARPLPELHSIWEIVLHIDSWQRVALGALQGHPMPSLPFAGDWPAVQSQVEPDWRKAVEALARGNGELTAAVCKLSDSRLEAVVPGRDYSFYYLLHGVTQHNLYHAGQIALLKKA